MKNLIIISLFITGCSGTSNQKKSVTTDVLVSQPSQIVESARFCSGLKPYCPYGQHVTCGCDSLGDNCDWVCVKD